MLISFKQRLGKRQSLRYKHLGNLSFGKTQLCHKLLVPFLLWLHVEIRSSNRNKCKLSRDSLILFFTFYLNVLSLRKLIPDFKVLGDSNEQYQVPSQ